MPAPPLDDEGCVRLVNAGGNVRRPNLRRDASTPASWPAGFIAVAISYAGPLLVTLEAAIAADLSPQLTASWVVAASWV